MVICALWAIVGLIMWAVLAVDSRRETGRIHVSSTGSMGLEALWFVGLVACGPVLLAYIAVVQLVTKGW